MIANPRPKTATRRKALTLVEFVVVFLICAVLAALFLPSVRRGGEAARRSQCKNNLKQILLALYNYNDRYGALPPAYTVDADGKPLHSWRTLILPYVEEQTLYDKIDLTKAWDDPANAEACKTIVSVYQCPSASGSVNHTKTNYMAVVTSTSCFRPTEPRLLSEITDGTSNTLMLIEVDSERAVHWMAPHDLGEAFLQGFGSMSNLSHVGGMHIAMVDGTVRFLNVTVPPEVLRALISIAGNEKPEF